MAILGRGDERVAKGEALTAQQAEIKITRDGLLDGSLLAFARAHVADAKIDPAVEQTLSSRPDTPGLWLFSYGSLMWNPTFFYAERRKATLPNWQRHYCAWSPIARGTPECPTLVLGLEAGGRTEGIAYRSRRGKNRVGADFSS
jgi:cation transport protein ChaC